MLFPSLFRRTALSLSLLLAALPAFAGSASQKLQQALASSADSVSVGTVIVTFNAPSGLQSSHLSVLQSLGIVGGKTYPNLGMVAAIANAGQVRALLQNPNVLSVWSNEQLAYYNNETRILTGVDKMRTDPNFIRLNGGLPVSGAKGGIAVVVNDSGIDATHNDLHYPEHVIQNVQTTTQDDLTGTGFAPFIFQEGVPDTDTAGHGTHCAGIVGGTGAQSGGLYAGVAPGANIIGVGSGAALFVLNALGGFEYALANQYRYNIRVITNSFGPSGSTPYDPNDPINVASKQMHDHNIVVTFAAGNDGPVQGTLSPYAAAPWVIGVAAGTKEGGLANFSSRGFPQTFPDHNNTPTLTAPGTGREFASDAGKFTTDIVSVKSKTATSEQGLTNDTELSPSYIPFYTQISGTSMATPFVAGTAALMLSVDPTLSPDDIKTILTQTATQMPGFKSWEVGAGYINVYAAIDKVFHRAKQYGSYGGPIDVQKFNAKYTISGPPAQNFHIDYNPLLTTGNSVTFSVPANMNVLDILAVVDTNPSTGNNLVGLIATDPAGKRYTSGIQLPVIGTNAREITVQFPVAGTWTLSVGGARGLTAVPVSSPTQLAGPGPVDGTITLQQFNLQNVPDIQNSPVKGQISQAIVSRMIDIFPDGNFHPTQAVYRMDFARALVTNSALRQSLADAPLYNDVRSFSEEAMAEAVTAMGPTLRDYDFNHTGLFTPASGSSFGSTALLNRLDIAVALVKALGQDDAAKALAGTNVTVNYNGQTLTLADNNQIPSDLRGYVQIALNRGLLQAFYTLTQSQYQLTPTITANFQPAGTVDRAMLAVALLAERQAFLAGN